jgi:hypothetical protein
MNSLRFCDIIISRLCGHGDHASMIPLTTSELALPGMKPAISYLQLKESAKPDIKMWKRFLNSHKKSSIVFFEVPESFNQAIYAYRSIMEVLEDFRPQLTGVPYRSRFSALKTMMKWSLLDFVPNLKFFTSFLMADFLGNELPERPSSLPLQDIFLFESHIKKFLKNRLNSISRKNYNLFFSILQGVKRGCTRVPDSYVLKSFEKHRDILSTPPTYDWVKFMDFEPYIDRFFRQFKETSPELHEASSSASFGFTREGGGQKGAILRHFDNSGFLNPDELLAIIENQEVRSRPTTFSFEEIVVQAESESHDVMVSEVREPLKVRLITKGAPFRYYFSRFFQKHLWRYLTKFPQFVLTSTPLKEDHLHDLLIRESRVVKFSSPFWVSGDYSAATDNLNIFYTKAVFERTLSLSGLEDRYLDLLRSVIYEQNLNYPKWSLLESKEQLNGQLMGSTLSFPILCTINLIGYWMSLEKYLGQKVKLKDLPVLVNGDDILFRSDKKLYEIWSEQIKELGFKFSLGKNYTHKSFLTVNSQGFIYDEKTNLFSQVKYFNCGLIRPTNVDAREKSVLPIWDRYNQLTLHASNINFAHTRFLNQCRVELDSASFKGERNYFVSQYYGGLGFNVHPEIRNKIYLTNFQRKLGQFILGLFKSSTSVKFLDNQYLKFYSRITHLQKTGEPLRSSVSLKRNREYMISPFIGPLPIFASEMRKLEVDVPAILLNEPEPENKFFVPKIPKSILDRVRNRQSILSTVPRWHCRDNRLFTFDFQISEVNSIASFVIRNSAVKAYTMTDDDYINEYTE